MNPFALQARLARDHPGVALLGLFVVTVVLAACALLQESADDQLEAFLPESNAELAALEAISETFATDTSGTLVQVIARGDVLEPAAIEGVVDAIDVATRDAAVAPLVAEGPEAVFSYAHAVALLLEAVDADQVTSDDIDQLLGAVTAEDSPFGQLGATVDQVIARGAEGEAIGGLGIISLVDAPPVETREAALAAEEVISAADVPGVEVRTLSPPKLNDEIGGSQASVTLLLLVLAIIVMVVLLAIFYRSASDVALSLLGLVITVVWVFGLQGLLGPGGAGLLGPTNPVVTIIPVLLISLVVDFALQLTGRYRERLTAGDSTGESAALVLRRTAPALLLAAVTTAISFFTNLTSPIPALQDFGLLAGLGVLGGYLVMTTLVPAARSLLDRRRTRADRELTTRALVDALPGTSTALSAVARAGVRHPMPILVGVVVVGALAGFGITRLDTTFSTTQFLPSDSEAADDLAFLAEHLAGGTASASVLIEGPLDDRLARDVIDLEQALATPEQRPDGVTGPPRRSVLSLIEDLTDDSGLPGDDYSAELAQYIDGLDLGFVVEPGTFLEIFDQVGRVAPEELASVVSVDDDGTARTLLEVPIATGDQASVAQAVAGLERLWRGDDAQFIVTGPDVLEVSVTRSLTDNQGLAIVLTIVAGLIVLVLYFGLADLRPLLGVIAVLPIALVVVLILGTMALLGISYNVVTALITALTIGVGLDYTVHLIYRFLQELDLADGDVVAAMTTTMGTTGAALVASAVTSVFGFAVLLFSPLTPIRQFGVLTALTILYSFVVALVVLPPLLALWSSYRRVVRAGEEAGSRGRRRTGR